MSFSEYAAPPPHPSNLLPSNDIKSPPPNSRSCFSTLTKRTWLIILTIFLVLAIALGIGLGVGLTRPSPKLPSTPSAPLPNNTNTTTGSYFQPPLTSTFQIVLPYALNDTSNPASVYDIDLFLNPASTIASLHALNKSVICYFSAGSYENFRNDSGSFDKSDYGKELNGWPGEYWLNTNSTNVRSIMMKRLELAKSIDCDGVDPDNVDGYDNDTGFDLTTADAINYLTFLATEAHGLGLAIGLKNAGSIVNDTVGFLQWEVNEQCVQYQECDLFQPFIENEKPVFHIEYPGTAPEVSARQKNEYCNDSSAAGFDTVLKQLDLGDWVEDC